jgi:hypothetical protein
VAQPKPAPLSSSFSLMPHRVVALAVLAHYHSLYSGPGRF